MSTKKCNECNEIKTVDNFFKGGRDKDGYQPKCKPCWKQYITRIRHSKEGLIGFIYTSQKKASRQRGHLMPSYTKDELYLWVTSQPKYNTLYENYVHSGYNKLYIPSIDRLDNIKGYFLDNIELVTWEENNLRGHLSMRFGNNIHGINPQKAVIQYDFKGNKIKEYPSARQAQRETGVSQSDISKNCRGIKPQAKGFKWRFKDET